jgi:stage II sporulation protein D
MKRFILALIIFSLAVPAYAELESPVTLDSPAQSLVPKRFIFKGAGYGHGVGLSQYGAKGQALEGRSATEILNYYFPDAQVAPVLDSTTVSVNIAHQVSELKLSLAAGDYFTLNNEGMEEMALQGNSELNFEINGKLIAGPVGSAKIWVIKWNNPASVVSLVNGRREIKLNHGYIQLKSVKAKGIGRRIEATNLLRLHDEYLYGIAEVPSSWPRAALESQVIASRTYALMRMKNIKKACDCHVYNSKYDQAFVGYAKEGEARYGELWKAAVDATATDSDHGLAITVDQHPIRVFFSSSTGGMTQTAFDVWGTHIPHLLNIADPWSVDPTINKNYASWRKKVSQKAMARAFGLMDIARYEITERSASNSVLFITGFSSDGAAKTLPVGLFKTAVKLPSSWFDLPPKAEAPETQTPETQTATSP